MIYEQMFNQQPDKAVRAGIIGLGNFATAIFAQSQGMRRLSVPVIADANLDAALEAGHQAGIAVQNTAICESHSKALRAMEEGKQVILSDASLMMDLPVDIVVEATGDPEMGAHHGLETIRHGKHIAMVNKETDATVGPILKQMADQAGVVYTAVDGDQHGLLIGLVSWARELGLDVLCAGKARDSGILLDPATGSVSKKSDEVDIKDPHLFQLVTPDNVSAKMMHRREALGTLANIGSFDVEELTIVANATGLVPDTPELHAPVVRTTEIPQVLCPTEEGGILSNRGVIDMVTCIHHHGEPGLGGGVFIVVSCANDYSRRILTGKGLISNQAGRSALIYRPYHLCGVETSISILCAVLLGISTAPVNYVPRFDVVLRALANFKAGDCDEWSRYPGVSHSRKFKALMHPVQSISSGEPLPMQMIAGNVLAKDVKVGEIITTDMVIEPRNSVLWSLRAQQEEHFLGKS